MKYNKYILIGFIIWIVGLTILYIKLGLLITIAIWLIIFGNNIMLKKPIYMIKDSLIKLINLKKEDD